MSCDGYTPSTLMGNWFEEKQSYRQPQKMHREARHLRPDNSIKYVSGADMKDLGRKARCEPWDTKACLIDRGLREYGTQNKYSFEQERLDHYYGKGDERPIRKNTTLKKNTTSEPCLQTYGSIFTPMINDRNIMQINQKRDYTQYLTDFRSTLKRHPQDSNKVYDMTSYCEKYARPVKQTAAEVVDQRELSRDLSAGVLTDSVSKREGLKMTSCLTGEQYRDFPDPQFNTHVQRSWVYGQENSLRQADRKLEKSVGGMDPKHKGESDLVIGKYMRDHTKWHGADKVTSLPLENGERSFFPKIEGVGTFRRIRSNVTLPAMPPMKYR